MERRRQMQQAGLQSEGRCLGISLFWVFPLSACCSSLVLDGTIRTYRELKWISESVLFNLRLPCWFTVPVWYIRVVGIPPLCIHTGSPWPSPSYPTPLHSLLELIRTNAHFYSLFSYFLLAPGVHILPQMLDWHSVTVAASMLVSPPNPLSVFVVTVSLTTWSCVWTADWLFLSHVSLYYCVDISSFTPAVWVRFM